MSTPDRAYNSVAGSVRLTVLVENSVYRAGLLAEHGWSVWLEAGGQRVLFDTGQSDLLLANAQRLGVDLGSVDSIVLSHGHYDHGGGLAAVLAKARPGVAVWAHPGALQPKYHRGPTAVRSIGLPTTAHTALDAAGARWHDVDTPTAMAPGLWLTGPIPRRHPEEASAEGFCLDAEGRQDDPLLDDQALVIRTVAGSVVLLGCAHAGIINTLDRVQAITADAPLRAVIGGLHLRSASPERLAWTIDALRRFRSRHFYPTHCTGAAAVAALWAAFPGQCAAASVGTTLDF